MRVGLVGAGLQGRRRAPVLYQSSGMQLVVVASARGLSAKALANTAGCEAVVGWERVVARDDLDAILICTPTYLHASIAIAALKKGVHVLCEKPLARTVEEAQAMVAAASANRTLLKCGFNHRHHPGVQQARRWFEQGAIGEPIFARCRYGICGRPGYDKEWRADPVQSGGGHLMEQGIHGIDLARWFLGDFTQATGFIASGYWNMPVEDNAFALFRTARGQIASVHASLTQWKNLFSLEVYGKDGYVNVEGLGGGYGNERAILGKRDFSKPFTEEVVEYRGADRSWQDEWQEFVNAIKDNREPLGNGQDGLEALRLVHAIYEAARDGEVARL